MGCNVKECLCTEKDARERQWLFGACEKRYEKMQWLIHKEKGKRWV